VKYRTWKSLIIVFRARRNSMIWNQHTFMSNPLNTKSLKRHQDIGFRKKKEIILLLPFLQHRLWFWQHILRSPVRVQRSRRRTEEGNPSRNVFHITTVWVHLLHPGCEYQARRKYVASLLKHCQPQNCLFQGPRKNREMSGFLRLPVIVLKFSI